MELSVKIISTETVFLFSFTQMLTLCHLSTVLLQGQHSNKWLEDKTARRNSPLD